MPDQIDEIVAKYTDSLSETTTPTEEIKTDASQQEVTTEKETPVNDGGRSKDEAELQLQRSEQEERDPAVTEKQRRAAETLKTLLERNKSTQAKTPRQQSAEESAETLIQLAKYNPKEFLRRHGGVVNELDNTNADPTESLKSEISELKQRIEQSFQQEENYRKQQAYQESKNAVVSYVQANPEYRFIHAAGAHDAVFEHIYNHLQSTGEVLSEDDAARDVNDRLKQLAEKLAPAVAPQSSDAPSKRKQAKTLTNSQAAASGSSQKPLHELSEEEALRVMAERLEFKSR